MPVKSRFIIKALNRARAFCLTHVDKLLVKSKCFKYLHMIAFL